MRTGTLTIIRDLAETLNRLSNVAQLMPENGPVPWYVSAVGRGSIHFLFEAQHKENADLVKNAFAADDNAWTYRESLNRRAYDWVKRLDNGVEIIIDNAEPRSADAAGRLEFKPDGTPVHCL